MVTSAPTFPSDMIFEILSRASLKTLNTCRLVSKEWKHQIDELCCARTNNNNDNHTSGVFINQCFPGEDHCAYRYVPLNPSNPSAVVDTLSSSNGSLIPRSMSILASSKGILCLKMQHGYNNCCYYVHKPTTKQWRALPEVYNWSDAVGMMVLGSNPLCFKIVMLSCVGFSWRFGYTYHGYVIFDSQSWEWRRIKTQAVCTPVDISKRRALSIVAKSSFYWQTMGGDKILALHEPTETFHTFSLPESVLQTRTKTKHMRLVEFEGTRLGLIRLTRKDNIVELWLVEGDPIIGNTNKEVQWSKHLSVDIGMFVRSMFHPRPVCFSNCGIVLVDKDGEVVHYKIDSTFDTFRLDGKVECFHTSFQFESDFEFEIGCLNNHQGQIE